MFSFSRDALSYRRAMGATKRSMYTECEAANAARSLNNPCPSRHRRFPELSSFSELLMWSHLSVHVRTTKFIFAV